LKWGIPRTPVQTLVNKKYLIDKIESQSEEIVQ